MTTRARLIPLLLALAALHAACTLTFGPGAAQTLRLSYQLEAELPAGEPHLVQTLSYPEQVILKRRFLRLSGRLSGAVDDHPARLRVVARTLDIESGNRLHSLKLSVRVSRDGTFSAVKRLRRNLPAGSMTIVTVEPIGGDLERGAEVRLCVDIVARRTDFDTSACIDEEGGGDGEAPAPTTFSGVQEQIFTPSCAKGGCHSQASASAGLILEAGTAYGQLVNVPSNQVPFRLRVDPGNPDGSYLLMKLRGSAGISGVRMPLDGPPFLTEEQIEGIAVWIAGGAPND